jgi:hypothetical protein
MVPMVASVRTQPSLEVSDQSLQGFIALLAPGVTLLLVLTDGAIRQTTQDVVRNLNQRTGSPAGPKLARSRELAGGHKTRETISI